MAYRKYTENDIYMMTHRTREISGNPYMLFAAYLLSCLSDMKEPLDDDDEEDGKPKVMGETFPSRMLRRIADGCVNDFREAAETESTIEIFGKPYSIRKASSIDYSRLPDTITVNEGRAYTTITSESLNDVSEEADSNDPRLSFQDNKWYADKVVEVADNIKDGWDLLTDAEVLLYCWVKYCQKREDRGIDGEKDFMNFRKIYKDYFYITEKQFLGCLNGIKKWPVTPYSFSADKIRKLNESLGQESIIGKQP